jgi:hypothetical protein
MDDEEFLEDRRRALRDSVEYFSAKNKPERERWVCAEFVENLGIAYDDKEVLSSDDEPPDVDFRDARFEIKEVLDLGRLRHAEYKASLQRALETTDPQDLLKQFTPKDITPLQLSDRILIELKNLTDHYAPSVRTSLDLLFYVNLQEHLLKVGPMPEAKAFAPFGWRSISAVLGWGAIVFYAVPNAPSLLHSRVGTLTQRRFE